jgi:hypothetical protein
MDDLAHDAGLETSWTSISIPSCATALGLFVWMASHDVEHTMDQNKRLCVPIVIKQQQLLR